jgi:hypothetical protein
MKHPRRSGVLEIRFLPYGDLCESRFFQIRWEFFMAQRAMRKLAGGDSHRLISFRASGPEDKKP